MERIFTIQILPEDDGKAIRDILRNKLHMSTGLQRALKTRDEGVMLNNRRVFVSERVKAGDVLSLMIEEKSAKSESILPVAGTLDIVYEDADLLIINKPPHLPVHPSRGHLTDSLANIVAHYYQKKGENFVFRCVNRIDSGTSGLVAIAKNAYAHDRLSDFMREDKLHREYLAVACGNVEPESGTIDRPIARIYHDGIPSLRREVNESGERAVTHYQVLSKTECYSLLRLRLETGRTHQIRVHMSSIGHPLVGDFLYGVEEPEIITRTALHSAKLTLFHPVTGKKLEFTVPLPEDMKKLIYT